MRLGIPSFVVKVTGLVLLLAFLGRSLNDLFTRIGGLGLLLRGFVVDIVVTTTLQAGLRATAVLGGTPSFVLLVVTSIIFFLLFLVAFFLLGR